MMADLPPAPVNAPIVSQDGHGTADLVRWIKLLEAKIKALEARIVALEA